MQRREKRKVNGLFINVEKGHIYGYGYVFCSSIADAADTGSTKTAEVPDADSASTVKVADAENADTAKSSDEDGGDDEKILVTGIEQQPLDLLNRIDSISQQELELLYVDVLWFIE